VTYLRVSKSEQSLDNQRADVVRAAAARGLELRRHYEETVSGAARTRPAFDAMMLAAPRGEFNVLIVWALDRFGRSMVGNLNAVLELDRLGVQVISVREPWLDTGGPVRSLLVAIFSWVAEQERARLGERTRAGLERARARGARLGRPRRVITPAELELARELWEERGLTIRVIAQRMRIPRATLHRALEHVSKRGAVFELEKAREKRGACGASRNRTIGGR
jgi:DNA invertase Pin-like site-specific DNA recombinase